MNSFQIRALLAAGGLALGATAACAAPVLHITNGVLDGASGVIVDGVSYDVVFTDGTCISLYNGCADDSRFLFRTEAEARNAMTALDKQVWGTRWPGGNIRGCEGTRACTAILPFEIWPRPGFIHALLYTNIDSTVVTDSAVVTVLVNGNTVANDSPFLNFSVWTVSTGSAAVPEPASFGLAGLALVIAGMARPGRTAASRRPTRPTAG